MQGLPSAVIAQLRADTHITDFTTAVWELVANAVDAGARTIFLDVDPSQGYARVEDDGSGISYSSLQLLGTRSCTSKAPPRDTSSLAATYGTRGESLANLRLVSQLRVTSRAAQQFDTYTLTLPPIHPNTSPPAAAAPQPCAPRPHHGTTMIMQGFLLQQPVRQRLQQQDAGAALTSLVHHMALRMAGHQQVDFRLTTAAGRQQLLHLQAVSLCPCHAATILCVNMDCPSVPVSGLPCQYTRAAMPPGQLVPKALLSQCASHNKVQHAPPLTTHVTVSGLSHCCGLPTTPCCCRGAAWRMCVTRCVPP